MTLYSLVRIGARPGFLGPVVEAGFHQRAIRPVQAGTIDAAAIDSQVLAIELRPQGRSQPRRRRQQQAADAPIRVTRMSRW